jgi:tetratricopeptide (TPR) repeat protein
MPTPVSRGEPVALANREELLAAYRAELEAIRDDLYDELGNDEQAYAALWQGDELHPHTPEAEHIWRNARGVDPWRHHDLAILLHARAYDLEAAGDPDAERYWREALEQWAQVVADDALWNRLTAHLDTVTGQTVDREVIAAVRAQLPRDLLGVHVTLIAAYGSASPGRARVHARLLKEAPFDPEIVAELRHGLVADVVGGVHKAVQAARYADTIEQLRTKLAIDADHPELIRWLLHTTRTWNELLYPEGNWALIGRNLATAVDAAEPLGEKASDDDGPLRAELARLQYWRGLTAVREVNDKLKGTTSAPVRRHLQAAADGALAAFNRALRLDPNVVIAPFYSDLPMLQVHALVFSGLLELLEGQAAGGPTAAERHYRKATQRLRKATEGNADEPTIWLYLSDALLGPDHVSEQEMNEVRKAIARAEGLIGTSPAQGQSQQHKHLGVVKQKLAFKQLMVGDTTGLADLLKMTGTGS